MLVSVTYYDTIVPHVIKLWPIDKQPKEAHNNSNVDNLNNTPLVPATTPIPNNIEDLIPDNFPSAASTTQRWEVSKLTPRHREIMRRILEGATYIEIAQEMGLHTQTIMLVATSPLFRAALAEMESAADFSVIKRAESMANEALDVLKVLMRNARSESIRKVSADSILDRAGYAKVEKKLVGIVSGDAVIKELNRRRRESLEELNGNTNGNSGQHSTSDSEISDIETIVDRTC